MLEQRKEFLEIYADRNIRLVALKIDRRCERFYAIEFIKLLFVIANTNKHTYVYVVYRISQQEPFEIQISLSFLFFHGGKRIKGIEAKDGDVQAEAFPLKNVHPRTRKAPRVEESSITMKYI